MDHRSGRPHRPGGDHGERAGGGRVLSTLPLTGAQHGIWTGQQLDPLDPSYNCAEYVVIDGPLDRVAFAAAVRAAVDEAEALHVRIADSVQELRPPGDWPLPVVDLTAEPDPPAAALAWMRADIAAPVDLAVDPLFGQALLVTGVDRHVWHQRIHHVAADGYAFTLLARRVAVLYTAAMRGRGPASRPAAPLAPVVAADIAYRSSEQRGADRAHWLRELAGAPEPLTSAGSGLQEGHLAAISLQEGGLAATGADAGGWGWVDRVVAAVAVALGRGADRAEVVLGLPVACRLGTPAARTPCMAMNIVPLRVPLAGSHADVARAVAAGVAAGRAHHRYRYEDLARDTGAVGGGRALFGPIVNVLPFDSALSFAGSPGTRHTLAAGPVPDLSFRVTGSRSDALTLTVEGANPRGHADRVLAVLQESAGAPAVPRTVLDGGPLPPPVDVVPLVEEQVGPAVEHDGSVLSYAALLAATDTLIPRLRDAGAAAGRTVAIALPRGTDAVVAILAVLRIGAVWVPVDPDGPAERTAAILAGAAPAVVVTTDGVEPAPGRRELLGAAYVIHTSGSTGRPKGVVVGRRALAHFVAGAAARYPVRPGDRVLQFAPLDFDAAVEELFLTLTAGATLVLRPPDMIDSVSGFLDGCAGLGITVLDLPTAYWHEIAHAVGAGIAVLPPAVRLVVIGGEAAAEPAVRAWHAAVDPRVRLVNTYGPTEATVVATAAELTRGVGGVPIGRPLPGVRAEIVDGELVLGGGGLADGYLDGPAPAFTVRDGVRAYRTGDRVRLRADGQLEHAGRVDDQVKISGHRTSPREIEAVLLAHPRVREAAVVARSGRLRAHVVGGESPDELRRHVATHLPAAVVPAAFVLVERLPRTSSGKIDRLALAEPEARGAEPDDPLVRAALRVFREVLDPAAGVDDDFFALGGASLQTVQLANRLTVALGRDVTAGTVFRHPTPTALAHALSAGAEDSAADPAVLRADTRLPPELRFPRPAAAADGPVLLVGADTFVGEHLRAALLTAGERVVAVGDLTRPDLGLGADGFAALARSVDAVVHNGAAMNMFRGYAGLRAQNVSGTRELLRLAAVRGIPVHHVSTLAVGAVEESFLDTPPADADGYRQGRWVIERLLEQAAERGLPVTVHRAGRVVGAASGRVNAEDLLWRVLRAGVPVGALPDVFGPELWTAADELAAAVAGIVRSGGSGVVHVVGDDPVTADDVMGALRERGHAVALLPVDRWRSAIGDDPQSVLTAAGLPARVPRTPDGVATARGRAALARAGRPAPTPAADLLPRLLDRAVRDGLIPGVR